MDGLSQQDGVLIASLENTPIGYSRLGWYSSRSENRLYYQVSFLRQEFRSRDIWPQMIANNERHLRILSCSIPKVAESYFQAWASDNQKDWMSALESCGYQVVRRFNNMLFPLGKVPVKDMRVVYTQRHRDTAAEEKYAAEFVSLDDLLRQSDFVSLHAQELCHRRTV